MTLAVQCQGIWKSYRRRPRLGIKAALLTPRAPDSRFARHWALQNVSFEVRRGQAFGIVGHNGSGKTTLLSLLLGSLLPDRGALSIHGRVASLIEIGAGFHPELTGRENVRLFGSILGMRLREIRERYDRVAHFSELGDAVDEPLRTYSAGMIARLGFSIIAHSPADVLLVDEVLAVGDARFQDKCHEMLFAFKASGGSLVIVSHNMEALTRLCEFGLCLDSGAVAAHGPIGPVIDYYATLTANRPKAISPGK